VEEQNIPQVEEPEDEALYCDGETGYEIIEIPNEEETPYVFEGFSITPASGNSGITFSRQGQSQIIGEITLVTNGTAAERSVDIDSILTGVAIQPYATWEIQNTSVATLSGWQTHPLWDYAPMRTGWVRTVDPNSGLFVRNNTLGAGLSYIRGENPNNTPLAVSSRRLGTEWIRVHMPIARIF